jgi:hypothetical protein
MEPEDLSLDPILGQFNPVHTLMAKLILFFKVPSSHEKENEKTLDNKEENWLPFMSSCSKYSYVSRLRFLSVVL